MILSFLESIGKLKLHKKKIEKVEDKLHVTFSDNSIKKYDEIINMAGYKRIISSITSKIEDINTELGYNYCLPKSSINTLSLAFIVYVSVIIGLWYLRHRSWFTECIKNDSFPDIKTQ